jgi:large subunit ribosomal protein L21
MYVIFETGGKQYKAAAGDVVRVEKLPEAEEGKKVKLDKILAVNDGKETHIGTPYLDAATVDATVTSVGKGDKVIVFKFKAKKGYRRKQGHRQPFTEIEIESVSLGGKTVFKKEAPKKAEKPAPTKKDEDGEPEKPADAKDEASVGEAADTDKTETKPAELKKDEKPAESEDKEEAKTEPEAKQPEKSDADSADKPDSGEEKPAAETQAKMTKADIMAKLDELGASYAKSAKKDELLAILAEAEKK